MNELLKENCIYCKGDIYYSGHETLVKCAMCGKTFAVAHFQSEQAKLRQALDEGDRVKAALAEAEAQKADAQGRLHAALSALESIDISQKAALARLGELYTKGQEDRASQKAAAELLSVLKTEQESQNDTLGRLMRAVASGRSETEGKLEHLQSIAEKILGAQGDALKQLNANIEIVPLLRGLKMDTEERQRLESDFVAWSQSIHAADEARLKSIQVSASTLLAGQRQINDKVDHLRHLSEETNKAVADFRNEYQADKRIMLNIFG